MQRIISLITAVMLILTIIPVSVTADTYEPTVNDALNTDGGTLDFVVRDWEVVTAQDRVYAASVNHDDDTAARIKLVFEAEKGSYVSFDAATDCEDGSDRLVFAVDADEIMTLTGKSDWDTYRYSFTEEGTYVLTWTYYKDADGAEGEDTAMLDNVFCGVSLSDLTDIQVPRQIALLVGGESEIYVHSEPYYTSYGNITFVSANEEIATVSESGTVKGISIGETVIYVTSDLLPGVVKQVRIIVSEPIEACAFLISYDEGAYAEGLYGVELVTNTFTEKLKFSDFLQTYRPDGWQGAEPLQDYVTAAEYADGHVYMFTKAGCFAVMDAKNYEDVTVIGDIETGENLQTYWRMADLSFDYATYTLYGLAYAPNGKSYIVTADTENGGITVVAPLPFCADVFAGDNGVFYTVDGRTGDLYSIKITDTVALSKLGNIGIVTRHLQSMAFDHEMGELYWTGLGGDKEYADSEGMSADLYSFSARINLEECCFDYVTEMKGIMQFTGLYFEYTDSGRTPVRGITLDKSETELTWGGNATLTAEILPENASVQGMTWTSSDDRVASVKDGVVTATGNGEAVVTVKTKDGGFTAECKVKVTGAPTYLTYEPFEGDIDSWQKSGFDRIRYEDCDFRPYDGIYCMAAQDGEGTLISPVFTVYDETTLSWFASSQTECAYSVYIVPAEQIVPEDGAEQVYDGAAAPAWEKVTVDVSAYAGQTVRMVIKSGARGLMIDCVEVYTFAEFPSEPEYMTGDTNGDGEINTADAVVILKFAAGMTALSDAQTLAGDVNRDGEVRTDDAVIILRYAAGMIEEF